MARENRRPPVNLIDDLEKKGNTFSFFQAMRLLRFHLGRNMSPERDPLRESVRVRSHLSFAHPPTEIASIEKKDRGTGKYLMTATFLGLYGEFSPLPAFYTEDLIEEERAQERDNVTRDFYDMLNYELYFLFYQAWARHRPALKVIDEKDPKYLEILYSLLGLGVESITDEIQAPQQLLRYIGLLTQYPKSGAGLRQLLADALDEPRLEIIPCIHRQVKIPDDQRCFLGVSGNVLGRESYLGQLIADRTRKYRVKIGPVDGNRYRQLLPGTFKYRRIISLARLYLIDSYESDLELVLEPNEAKSARLGDARWSRLGYDTWLFSGEDFESVSAVFELQ